jgi:hypothetical protein
MRSLPLVPTATYAAEYQMPRALFEWSTEDSASATALVSRRPTVDVRTLLARSRASLSRSLRARSAKSSAKTRRYASRAASSEAFV